VIELHRRTRQSNRCRRKQRRWGWLLLVALLFVQAKVAIAGCLLDAPYRPSPAMAAAMAQDAAAMDACCPESDSSSARCADDCKPSASVPKPATDHASIVPAFECGLRLPDVLPRSSQLSVGPAAAPHPSDGPPAYLRYLRLLN
jgi:hypothetical protein